MAAIARIALRGRLVVRPELWPVLGNKKIYNSNVELVNCVGDTLRFVERPVFSGTDTVFVRNVDWEFSHLWLTPLMFPNVKQFFFLTRCTLPVGGKISDRFPKTRIFTPSELVYQAKDWTDNVVGVDRHSLENLLCSLFPQPPQCPQ
jgi:hypothetical protein